MFRTRFLCLFGAALAALAVAAPALGDVKITDRQYVRHDGGQDATTIDVLDEQPAAERAGGRGQSDAAEQDDGRRERLLHGSDERRRVGRLLLQRRTAARRGRTACCRAIRTTPRPRAAVTALRARARRGRSGPGLGPLRQRLLRRDRVQPRRAGERLDLGRPLQLGGGRDTRLPGHGDRLARHAEPDLPRATSTTR